MNRLVADLAEPVLRDRGLLLRPIPFFEHFDQFRNTEAKLSLQLTCYLTSLSASAALRTARSYAFANELTGHVLRSFCPAFPPAGEEAQCLLWAAAVLLDQILDEEKVEPEHLAPVSAWIGRQSELAGQGSSDKPYAETVSMQAFVAMLADLFADCRRRASSSAEYRAFHKDLIRIFDAELASMRISVEAPPEDRVRGIVYDKSVRLCWVGFRAGILGTRIEPATLDLYRWLCDRVGEVLWIMDDLADLEEDLDRGVWNRSLWNLYDRVGEARFRNAIRWKRKLAQTLCKERLVEQAIHDIAERISSAETHQCTHDASRMRSMLSFWITSGLGIYE